MAAHVTEIPLLGSIESILRQAEQAGLILPADLATSQTAVINAIETRGAKMHVSLRPAIERVKAVIPLISRITGNPALVTGGSLQNIYAAIPGEWSVGGMSPGL